MRKAPRTTGEAARATRPAKAKNAATPPSRQTRARLDVALVERGLAPTREKAARLIMAGSVRMNGQLADKSSALVDSRARLEVVEPARFVSRGGDKLAHALQVFGISAKARICLDVGASTGGFTHCLLEAGAVRVYSVDVGQGQLDASLRADGRVVVMERTNARQLTVDAFPQLPQLATVDVSFISLEKVLPAIHSVLSFDGEAVILIKPQFEVGKGQVGKGGVVRDGSQHREVMERLARYCVLHGWHVRAVTASPLKGPKGNREFFLHIALTGRTGSDLSAEIERLTTEAPV
ncbi:MAG TPA: TlyA family RNA methyltransferase [Candidatus Limnocylindrales bacterium]|nr:TlyA family RNA methyltransferase [Candidatus Limnocylindrales bacterium]